MDPMDPILDLKSAPSVVSGNRRFMESFTAPSPIQSQAWPYAFEGKDVISIAKTGSGKTLGFLMPAFNHIQKVHGTRARRGDGPAVVILAPTRELAQQIEKECLTYGGNGVRAVCVFGGVSKGPQIRALKQGVDIIIATPGRLNDLLQLDFPQVTNLRRATFLVLDEADRMLDMGFEPQLQQILSFIPKENEKQTLMFSATWPKEVRALAAEFLKEPTQINIGGSDLSVNKDVSQEFHLVEQRERRQLFLDRLVEIFKNDPQSAVIVFCNTKSSCEYVAEAVYEEVGVRANSLHGDKSQDQREWALRKFRDRHAPVIVATDVAARGLDIKGVSHVINLDFPSSGTADWVHRVGRTGRAGAKGVAITFMQEEDSKHALDLRTVLTKAGAAIPDWLENMARAIERRRNPPPSNHNRYRRSGNSDGRWGNRGGNWGNRNGGGYGYSQRNGGRDSNSGHGGGDGRREGGRGGGQGWSRGGGWGRQDENRGNNPKHR